MPSYAGDGEKHEGHAGIWNLSCRPDRVCGHWLLGDAQSFTGPVLDVFFGASVAKQPMTTNAIRTARKIPNSSVSFMLFSVARVGWHQVLRSHRGSLGLSGLSKWSILDRLILSMRARFSAVWGSVKSFRSGSWHFRQVISTQFRQVISTKNTHVTLQKIRNRALLTAKWRLND